MALVHGAVGPHVDAIGVAELAARDEHVLGMSTTTGPGLPLVAI